MLESLLPYRTILLLGASGQVGTAIRTAFARLAPHCHVICASRSAPKEDGLWITLDPLSGTWPNLPQVDVVVNAIGAIHATVELPFERVHGGVTEAILAHRAELGNPKIVQISALGASVTHASAFMRSKGEADAVLMRHPGTVVLRPSIVCTPGTMLSRRLLTLLRISRFSLGKLLVPRGFADTRIQPIMDEDLGQAVVAACLLDIIGNQPLSLVGPEEIALDELLHEMSSAQGRSVRLIEVPREIVESFVRHFVSVWFPDVLSADQFQLLFEDNVAPVAATVNLLGKRPASTLTFWRSEAAGIEVEAVAEGIPQGGLSQLASPLAH